MNVKRVSSAALALTLAASLAPACLAAPDGAAPQGGYKTVISINGKRLESFDFFREVEGWGSESVTWLLTELSPAPAGYVPMRAVAQADHGTAFWDQEGGQGWFTLEGAQITVFFDDLSVTVNDEKLEGVSAVLTDGVTYLPVSVIDGLEGYSVADTSADGTEGYEITTPNGAPVIKLAYELAELGDLGVGMKSTPQELEDFYGESHGLKAEYMTEGVAFLPMMTTPDTLILGKAAQGKTEALETALEAYRKTQEDTFTWYLSQNLPKVEDARFVTAGDWFLFYIGENADAVAEAFQAAAPELDKA